MAQEDPHPTLSMAPYSTHSGEPEVPYPPCRQYVLSILPRITTFDFSGVTKQDRITANIWRRMNIKPKRVRIKLDNI